MSNPAPRPPLVEPETKPGLELSLSGLVFALISAAGFGMLSIVAKLAYSHGLTAYELLQIRFTLAVPMMALVLLIKDPSLLKPSWPLLAKTGLLGGVFYGIQSGTFFIGLNYIPAATAALILCFYPVYVAILSWIFLKQRLDRMGIIATLLVLGGCGLVFYDAFLRSFQWLGVLLAMTATLAFSFYLVLTQVFLRKETALGATFYVIVFAALTFNLLAGPDKWLDYDPDSIIYGGIIGLVSTVMAISLLFLAIERIGSTYTSIFSTFEPVCALTAAWLVLDEVIVFWQLAGMSLVIVGIILPNWKGIKGI